jgi:hypothetical protein
MIGFGIFVFLLNGSLTIINYKRERYGWAIISAVASGISMGLLFKLLLN